MFSGNFTSAEWSGQKEESGEGEGNAHFLLFLVKALGRDVLHMVL